MCISYGKQKIGFLEKQKPRLIFLHVFSSGSSALPSNMAFLASGREKESGDKYLTSCLSTNRRTAESTDIFRRTGTHSPTCQWDVFLFVVINSHHVTVCPAVLQHIGTLDLWEGDLEAPSALWPPDHRGRGREKGERRKCRGREGRNSREGERIWGGIEEKQQKDTSWDPDNSPYRSGELTRFDKLFYKSLSESTVFKPYLRNCFWILAPAWTIGWSVKQQKEQSDPLLCY